MTDKPTTQDATATSTAARKSSQKAPDIGFVGMLRWAWRQLTTMKFALILLLVLALAAIPGSLLPQRIQDPAKVQNFIIDNGRTGEILDKFQMFDVYSSFWFSAVYILLMISLVGCVLPRTKQHWKAMRSQPPKAPRRLTRMPGYQTFVSTAPADAILDTAQEYLKKNGYRTVNRGDHIAAERGYLRETGNLLFHLGILGATIVMAIGAIFGYGGQRVLVEGDTFTNSLVSYDSFEPGRYFDADNLTNFRLRLDSFDSKFDSTSEGAQFGQPRAFEAVITETKDGVSTKHNLKVNEPIRVGGAGVYLTGNGYAPVVTVRDAQGKVTYSGPVVFVPEDGVYTSRGVIKVPDTGAGKDQLGFSGILLPTAGVNDKGELYSQFAELRNPVLVMNLYKGDLGLDTGIPQNVYELDTAGMEAVNGPDGQQWITQMQPGDTAELPDGLGTVEFERVAKFVSLDVRHDPVQGLMLVVTTVMFIGLALAMFIPRRRMWVRVRDGEVEVGALARSEDPRVKQAAERCGVELQDRLSSADHQSAEG